MKVLGLVALVASVGCSAGTGNTHRVAYPNGYARFEFQLREGLPNGRGRVWYPSGALELVGTYVDGARHGRFWFFTESGAPAYQAIYFDNAEVWRSTDPDAEPPANWAVELARSEAVPTASKAERVESESAKSWLVRSPVPAPAFASLDRITIERGGVQVGVGGAETVDFGSVIRVDVFGHYRFSRFGAYAQLSQTQLAAQMETLAGRRTFELGGTGRRGLLGGKITGRAGLLVPVGNDDTSGFVASTAGVAQRPADAASSFASSVSARTSASFVTTGERSVVQIDAGVDWLLGTETRAVDALVRANAGVGLGTRRAMLTIELSNTLRVAERTRLHALVLGGTATFAKVWLGANVSITHEAAASVLTSVGYDL
ncbi:MAG: hypothetical protein H0T42_20190 [Deltaproteobacteria bacterium]|nr:hypothetical protein [Deltaproteobacteria bacterium]